MILIHIATSDEKQANEIASHLVGERLVLDTLITKTKWKYRAENGKVEDGDRFLILGKTKALLFDTIDEDLRANYSDNMPTIYSVPIVHMDWDQSAELKQKTEKV